MAQISRARLLAPMLVSLGLLASVASASPLLYRGTEDVVAAMSAPAVAADLTVWVDRSDINEGESALGYVELASPAPAGGATVSLYLMVNLSWGLTVPETVKIPAGQTRASFPVLSFYSFSDVYGSVRATYGDWTAYSSEVRFHGVTAQVTGNKTSFYGGSTTEYKLTVKLSLAPPQELNLYAYAWLPRGSTDTTILKFPAGQDTAETTIVFPLLDANYKSYVFASTFSTTGNPGGTTVRVLAIKPTLVMPTSDIQRGKTAMGKVVLSANVREAATISLNSNTNSVTVPATVTVPAGAKEVTFPMQGVSTGYASIQATFNRNTATSIVWVVATGVEAVELPAQMPAQRYFTGTVRLIDPAPAGGRVVQLAAVDPGLRTAPSVTIPQGQTSADFSIVSNDVTELQNARVVATLGDSTATASMVVKPLAIKAFALSAATVKGGVSVDGTVTLDEVVGVNTLVTVESADPAVVVVPSSTTVVKGGKARTFTIKTKAVTAAKYVKITVTKNGTSTYRTLKVTP